MHWESFSTSSKTSCVLVFAENNKEVYLRPYKGPKTVEGWKAKHS